MPAWVPDLKDLADTKPWEGVLALLSMVDAAKVFSKIQRQGAGKAGFIIAGWDEQGDLKWYLNESGYVFDAFEDDTTAECPKLYATFQGARNKIGSLRKEIAAPTVSHLNENIRYVGLAVWTHPEAYDQELDTYIKMIGGRLPGSPRQ